MVARLPTEQEAVGSSPTSGLVFCVYVGEEKGGLRVEEKVYLGVAGSTPALGLSIWSIKPG